MPEPIDPIMDDVRVMLDKLIDDAHIAGFYKGKGRARDIDAIQRLDESRKARRRDLLAIIDLLAFIKRRERIH